MNLQQIDFNTGNLRLAPNISSPTPLSSLVPTIDLSVPGSDLVQLDTSNNNNNNNNNNSGVQPSPSSLLVQTTTARFASSQSSPSLDDCLQTISVAMLNVRGINDVTKFDGIIDDLFNKNLSIIGLTETLINEISATCMFKNQCALRNSTFPYRAYWDYNPHNRNSGVGIILKSFVARYVQKITRHMGRFIAVDLFLPSRKLKIINIYNCQKY